MVNDTADQASKLAQLAKAYNYIIDIYGSLDGWQESAGDGYDRPILAEGSTYALAQAVTWMILHEDIDRIVVINNNHGKGWYFRFDGTMHTDGDCWPHPNDCCAYVPLNAAILKVMGNYANADTGNTITEVVFLADATYGTVDDLHIQPQVVPVFGGGVVFNNITKTGGPEEMVGGLQVFVDVVAEWYVEYHKPVFLSRQSTTSTLVSVSPLSFGNGHRYVMIDVEAARETSLSFGIGNSANNGGGPQTETGYFYNVKVEGDSITVYFDDNLIRANFGFEVKNTAAALAGGPSNVNHSAAKSQTLPLPAGYGDFVFLYFHNSGGIQWYPLDGTGNRIITDCIVDYTEGPYEFEYLDLADFDGTIAVKLFYADGDEVFRGLFDFDGPVLGEDGEQVMVPVLSSWDGINFPYGATGLKAGEYTFELWINSEKHFTSESVTIVSGDTTVIDDLVVIIELDDVVVCCVCNCVCGEEEEEDYEGEE
jgi:hypothetical protein